MCSWQLQEARQRFSELMRAVESDGPQFVTRHGREVAVVLEIEQYHRLTDPERDFKAFLRDGPDFEDLETVRDTSPSRRVDLAFE